MSETAWWRNPQGIGAMLSIVAVVLTFFFVRERRDWEQSARITSVESRGDKAIVSAGTRFERLESALSETRDRMNFLEREIDRLKLKADERERHYPQ